MAQIIPLRQILCIHMYIDIFDKEESKRRQVGSNERKGGKMFATNR